MTPGPTRSILVGALAAVLILVAPSTATAAVPGQVASSALYGGAQIPSTKAELMRYASVLPHAPVYSEPTSSNMSYFLPGTAATGVAEDQIRVSEPFAANGDEWVAIQVPDEAHGRDSAKSNLTEPGVAYIRAGAVTTHYPWLSDGPTTAPSAGAQAYPSKKSDLVTTAHLDITKEQYRHPTASQAEALNAPTNRWGTTLKSSEVFTYGGSKWVAVEVAESLNPGGVAYVSAEKSVLIDPVKPQAAASVTSAAAPSADPSPTTSPAVAAPAAAVPNEAQSNWLADVAGKALNALPMFLIAVLAMGGTLFLTKRRPA